MLRDKWKDKINDVDAVDAGDINSVANAVIDIEDRLDDLPEVDGGGNDSQGQDNTFRLFVWLNWDSLTADFPTGEFPSWASLNFQDIYQAFSSNKSIVTRITWYDDNDDTLSRNGYTSNIAYYHGFEDDLRKKQIIISAILNIDVQNGLGKQDYYFKFILNEDDTVTTEYQLIGGDSALKIITPVPEVSSIEDVGVNVVVNGVVYYHKVVDNVYTQDELSNRAWELRDSIGNVKQSGVTEVNQTEIGEKSFRINNGFLWVIDPDDVGKEFMVANGIYGVFPEAGTYAKNLSLGDTFHVSISGERQKSATANDFPLIVYAKATSSFFAISDVSCSYKTMLDAFESGRNVRLHILAPGGDDRSIVQCNLTAQEGVDGDLAFEALLSQGFDQYEISTPCLYRVMVSRKNTLAAQLVPIVELTSDQIDDLKQDIIEEITATLPSAEGVEF